MSSVATQRRGRAYLGVLAVLVAALTVSGCQSKIGAAAVIGDQRISDKQLQSIVNQSLDAPGVRSAFPASNYKGDVGMYRRAVLNVEVERLLAEASASREGITVGDNLVDDRYRYYEEQAGGSSEFVSQLASQLAVSPELYRKLVRTEVVEAELGYQKGGVSRPTDRELQSAYREYVATATTAKLGLIQVPDAATASRVLAQTRGSQEAFTQAAAQYTGNQAQTAPEPTDYVLSRLPADLAKRAESAREGETFVYTLESNGAQAFFVIRFTSLTRPTFEASKPQLVAQSLKNAATAGQKYLVNTANAIGVSISPRYGGWDASKLQITEFDNPAVKPLPTATLDGGSQVVPDGSTGG